MSIQSSTYSPDIAVPTDKRVFGGRDLFSLWFSLGIGLMVLQTGALLAPGLGMSGSLLAIFFGTAVGVLLLAAVGVIGSDTGLSSMAALKLSLGNRGASLPALLNLLQLVGWGSFEIIVMRDAASLLGARAFSEGSLWSNPVLWTLFFGALATLLAVSGPLTFVRQILRKWGIWLLLAACLWLTWNLLAKVDLAALWAQAGDGSMQFAVGFDIAIAMPLSWLPLIADYSRFGKRARTVFGGTALGFFIGNLWLMSLGVAYTLAFAPSGEVNALLLALAGAGLGIPLLLILLDESENAFADIHSAAVSSGILLRLKVEHLALAIGVLCTVIACLAPLAKPWCKSLKNRIFRWATCTCWPAVSRRGIRCRFAARTCVCVKSTTVASNCSNASRGICCGRRTRAFSRWSMAGASGVVSARWWPAIWRSAPMKRPLACRKSTGAFRRAIW